MPGLLPSAAGTWIAGLPFLMLGLDDQRILPPLASASTLAVMVSNSPSTAASVKKYFIPRLLLGKWSRGASTQAPMSGYGRASLNCGQGESARSGLAGSAGWAD